MTVVRHSSKLVQEGRRRRQRGVASDVRRGRVEKGKRFHLKVKVRVGLSDSNRRIKTVWSSKSPQEVKSRGGEQVEVFARGSSRRGFPAREIAVW